MPRASGAVEGADDVKSIDNTEGDSEDPKKGQDNQIDETALPKNQCIPFSFLFHFFDLEVVASNACTKIPTELPKFVGFSKFQNFALKMSFNFSSRKMPRNVQKYDSHVSNTQICKPAELYVAVETESSPLLRMCFHTADFSRSS